jgi:long-chain acyl-CoA synthetase
MNIIDLLRNNAEKYPSKIGFIDEENEITFQKMLKNVEKFSSSELLKNKNQTIGLILENSIEDIIAYLGIINSGKIVHIIPPNITEKNFINQIKSSNPSTIICSKKNQTNFLNFNDKNIPIHTNEEIISKSTIQEKIPDINKIAYLIYTSGTTSEPKGVPISHEMIEFTTKNIVKILGYSKNDIDLTPLPLYHSFGLGCLHTSIHMGSTFVLLKNANNLENILNSLKKFNATTLAVVPVTLTKLLRFENQYLKEKFSNIRLVITNSTSIPKNTVISFKAILENRKLATYYGLTEASRSTFMIFNENTKLDESVGKPAPGVKIKIEKFDKKLEIGEITIQGKNVIKNYWKNPIADKNLDGNWLQTNDVGYFDNDENLFLVGRNDDIINIGGEKVIPSEIEEMIKQIPGIEDVVAFGIDNEIFGKTIKVNIIKKNNSNLDKIKILSYCLKNLEKFKIPSKIEFVDKIPKNEYGKVKRSMLK